MLLSLAALLLTGAVVTSACAAELLAHKPIPLHSGPGNDFATLATLPAGMKFTVLWCNAAADWCLLQHELAQGWAPISVLKPDGGLSTLAGGRANPDNGGGLSALANGSDPGDGTAAPLGALPAVSPDSGGAGGIGLSVGGGGASLSLGGVSLSVKTH